MKEGLRAARRRQVNGLGGCARQVVCLLEALDILFEWPKADRATPIVDVLGVCDCPEFIVSELSSVNLRFALVHSDSVQEISVVGL